MTQTATKPACIPVFSNRLAGVLMAQGYVLQDMKTNNRQDQQGRNVFYFVDSAELQQAIADYTAKANKA